MAAAWLALLVACAGPSGRYERAARELGFERRTVRSDATELAVFGPRDERAGARLHVYIEGDGLPRRAARFVPPDPTPAEPLMLRLMQLDRAPALLLGRPCHHAPGACDARAFTLGRYGEPVVEAMAEALRLELRRAGARELVLIGFSGGGALALLLAERLGETVAVVTIAGNLDVDAWARHHGYAPLRDSLDPADRPLLPPRVLRLHLRGGRDAVVPPQVTRAAIARDPAALAWLFRDFDHRCCWREVWPAVLDELARRLDP